MASILDYNLDNRKEVKVLPKGEYELTIEGTKTYGLEPDDDSAPRLSVRCACTSEPLSDDIFHTIWLPNPEKDSEKQINKKLNTLAAFIELLGLEASGKPNLDDWVGCTFRAILGVDTYKGEKRNEILDIVGTGSSTALDSSDPEAEEDTTIVAAEDV